MFNAPENLHLAAVANSRNDHFAALGFLRDALAAEPKNVTAHYMLAMECAELGLTERAARELEETLALEPKMDAARLQLAVLYSQVGKSAAAQKHLALLQSSGNAELQAYADALLALQGNDTEKAKDRLVFGLRQVSASNALKRDMNKLFQSLISLPPAAVPAAAAAKPAADATSEAAPVSALPGAYEHIRAASR